MRNCWEEGGNEWTGKYNTSYEVTWVTNYMLFCCNDNAM